MCVIGDISTRTVWHWICSMCEHKKKRTANIVNLCRKKRITHTSTSDCNNKIPRFELEYMFNHVQRHTTCTDYFFLIKKKWVCCQFFCMLIFHCTDERNESQIIQLLNNCDRNKCGIPNIFLHIDFYCALHISKTTEKWIC